MQNLIAAHKVRPSADVSEDNHAYYIDINLPGAESSSLKVEVRGKELEVSAAMQLPNCPEHVLAMEFVPMEYGICFALSPMANVSAISAWMEYGVLRLTVPKKNKL